MQSLRVVSWLACLGMMIAMPVVAGARVTTADPICCVEATPVNFPVLVAAPCGSSPATTFDELGVPFINNVSTMVFHARRTYCWTGTPTYGIYTLTSSNLLGTVTEANEDGTKYFSKLSVIPSINDLGDVAFRGTRPGGAGSGVYARISGVITPIALNGNSAPGTPGYHFRDLGPDTELGVDRRRVMINYSKNVLFSGYAESADHSEFTYGVWVWSPTLGLQMILRTGAVPPDPANELTVSQVFDVDINRAGEVAVIAGCSDPYPPYDRTYHATWIGMPGAISRVDQVNAQDEVSGVYNGGPFIFTNTRAGLFRKEIYDEVPCARWVHKVNNITRMLIGGEPAVGTSCLEYVSGDCPPGYNPGGYGPRAHDSLDICPVMADSGKGFIRHNLYDRETNSCGEQAVDGFWFWNGTSATAVGIDEQSISAWTGTANEFIDSCTTGTTEVAINNPGQTAFMLRARRPDAFGGTDYGLALFGRSVAGGIPQLLQRENNYVAMSATGSRAFQVSQLLWGDGEHRRRDNIRSGHGLLNDSSQLVYWASLYNAIDGTRQALYRVRVR